MMNVKASPNHAESVPSLEITTPTNNATVPKNFNVKGNFETNGAAVVVTVKDANGAVVATGNAVVVNGKWAVFISVVTPGVNPHSVTATSGGESHSVNATINSLLASETDESEVVGEDP
jgi:hypothetical protein